ncbi:MAG: hypothetical protein GY737_10215 [Desulfobacteraceae bacterium]|nr:hypothetical protein [Desulfobacteraceae bacterium]
MDRVFLPSPFGHRLTIGLNGGNISDYFETRNLHFESGYDGNPLPIVAAANGGVQSLTVSLMVVNGATLGGTGAVVLPFWSAIRSCSRTLVELRMNLSFRHQPFLKEAAVRALANDFLNLEVLALEHNLYGLTMEDLQIILSSPTCKLRVVDNCQCSTLQCLVVDNLPDYLPHLEELCGPIARSNAPGPEVPMPPVWQVGPLPLRALIEKTPNLKNLCFNYTHLMITELNMRVFLTDLNTLIETTSHNFRVMVVSYTSALPRINFFQLLFEHTFGPSVVSRVIWSHRPSVLNCDFERSDGVKVFLSIVGCLSFCGVANGFCSYRRPPPPLHMYP